MELNKWRWATWREWADIEWLGMGGGWCNERVDITHQDGSATGFSVRISQYGVYISDDKSGGQVQVFRRRWFTIRGVDSMASKLAAAWIRHSIINEERDRVKYDERRQKLNAAVAEKIATLPWPKDVPADGQSK